MAGWVDVWSISAHFRRVFSYRYYYKSFPHAIQVTATARGGEDRETERRWDPKPHPRAEYCRAVGARDLTTRPPDDIDLEHERAHHKLQTVLISIPDTIHVDLWTFIHLIW